MPTGTVSLENIIVFDAKSRELFGNDELAFSYNGNAIQITINLKDFIKVSGVAQRTDIKKGRRSGKPKLSAWNKFVKANSKKPRFRLRSGSPNLKKLGVAFRKTPAGKKKRR